MNRNERVLLASSHGSVASICEVSFRALCGNEGEHPFPRGLGDTYAGKKLRTFSQSDISGSVLAGAKCFVYTIQHWRIAD
jgi:hypothetical protein